MAERMTWDHHANHDLLTAIMQELQPSQEQLRGVVACMHSFGYTCTLKAITYCLLTIYYSLRPHFHHHLPFLFFFFFNLWTGSLLTASFSSNSQHLQKLRRKDEKITSGGGNGDGPSTPKTPGGRKKNGPGGSVKKEPGSGTKRKPVAFIDDDSEDSKPVPVKKIKEESGVKSEESVR